MPHPIENIMRTTMEQLREIVDVNTVIGNPIVTAENTLVLPISKLSLGFLSGGGEYSGSREGKEPVRKAGEMLENNTHYPFAGTAAAGMSITPVGFLSVDKNNIRMTRVRYDSSLERAVDLIPESIDAVSRMVEEIRRDNDNKEHKDTPALS